MMPRTPAPSAPFYLFNFEIEGFRNSKDLDKVKEQYSRKQALYRQKSM